MTTRILGLRTLLNSTAMDIMYYTSPLYRSVNYTSPLYRSVNYTSPLYRSVNYIPAHSTG